MNVKELETLAIREIEIVISKIDTEALRGGLPLSAVAGACEAASERLTERADLARVEDATERGRS